YNELPTAALVAKHIGSEHTELLVKPDFTSLLPKMAWHLDEPFADSSAALTFLISEQASKHVKVALTGIGGDELFMGYPRYLGMRLLRYYRTLPLPLRRVASAALSLLPQSDASGAASGRVKRFARGALLYPLDCYLSWVSFLPFAEKPLLYSEEFHAAADGEEVFENHRAIFNAFPPELGDYRYPLLDIKTYLCDDLLMMGDKMSMASSLELRVPFCTPGMLELALSLGPERHLAGLKLKSFLKEAVAGWLPPELLKRRKQGFMLPLSRWLKEELREPLHDLLSERSVRNRGYFKPEAVSALIGAHESGAANNTDLLWALMMLEQWHRTYTDGAFRD
ncbi:MAG TPA: asparagine synthase C-terminal domain-containing protein, partial [Elusimicrobiales bacterium]|nr:asparagine synthase C-terminal domain-containing protein [Elusimicrobiales bacterium]